MKRMRVNKKQQLRIEKEREYEKILRFLLKERRALNRRIKAIEIAQKKDVENWRAELQRQRIGAQDLGHLI